MINYIVVVKFIPLAFLFVVALRFPKQHKYTSGVVETAANEIFNRRLNSKITKKPKMIDINQFSQQIITLRNNVRIFSTAVIFLTIVETVILFLIK